MALVIPNCEYRNRAHRGAFGIGYRVGFRCGLYRECADENPYDADKKIENKRNGNSFAIGLHRAWQAGYNLGHDEGQTRLAQAVAESATAT